MAKNKQPKRPAVAPKPKSAKNATEEQQARESYERGVRDRGEVSKSDAPGKLPPGVLYTEDAKGTLVRRRVSLIPPLESEEK